MMPTTNPANQSVTPSGIIVRPTSSQIYVFRLSGVRKLNVKVSAFKSLLEAMDYFCATCGIEKYQRHGLWWGKHSPVQGMDIDQPIVVDFQDQERCPIRVSGELATPQTLADAQVLAQQERRGTAEVDSGDANGSDNAAADGSSLQ